MTSMRLLAACLLMVSWPSAGAGEGAGPVGRVRVCPVTTLSVEGRVNRLSVHPDSRILSYTYAGEIGRRGGFRAIDYASGAQVDAVPSRTEPHVDALVSWNFKHIVRLEKIRLFNAVNAELGCKALSILSPREVTTYEGD